MNQHIGERIRERFEAKRSADPAFSKAEFARRIHVHRSTVYHLFERHSIDTELLRRISEALDYDFCTEILGQPSDAASPKVIVGIEISMEQLANLRLPKEFLRLTGSA
jgi:transcriptional regulator with XRE-family HTH domain